MKINLSENNNPPTYSQLVISDTTVEANASVFEDSPRGVILHRDEFSGFILSMNQYKANSKGGDKQHYLEIFDAKPLDINRVATGKKHIPNTGMALIGGISPVVLPKILSRDNIDDGFLPRFLLMHTGKKLPYTDKTIDKEDEQYWEDVVSFCYTIPLEIDSESGRVKPTILTLDKEAFGLYQSFRNEYDRMMELLSERTASFLPKLLTYCLKFAGILHILKLFDLNKNITANTFVNTETMVDAIKLTRYYAYQASKLVKLYDKQKELEPHQKRLVEVIYKLRSEVEGGRLFIKRITEVYNDGLPEYLILTEKMIGSILRTELHLQTEKSHTCYLIWDETKLQILFRTMSHKSHKSQTINNKSSINNQPQDNVSSRKTTVTEKIKIDDEIEDEIYEEAI